MHAENKYLSTHSQLQPESQCIGKTVTGIAKVVGELADTLYSAMCIDDESGRTIAEGCIPEGLTSLRLGDEVGLTADDLG